MRPQNAIVAGIASLALVLASASTAQAKPPTVFINGDSISTYKFTPRVLEIDRRQKADWEWDSNAAHNVSFPRLGKTSATGASETFKLKFKKRGTFRYLCTVHGFRAKIVVGR